MTESQNGSANGNKNGNGNLDWRDLSAAEVWNVAEQEKQARENAAMFLAKAAFSGDGLDFQNLKKAEMIMTNYERRAQSWLNDQREARGLETIAISGLTRKVIPKALKGAPISGWLNEQLDEYGIRARELALQADMGEGYISMLRNNTRKPKPETVIRIANAIADIRGLSKTARQKLVEAALKESHLN